MASLSTTWFLSTSTLNMGTMSMVLVVMNLPHGVVDHRDLLLRI